MDLSHHKSRRVPALCWIIVLMRRIFYVIFYLIMRRSVDILKKTVDEYYLDLRTLFRYLKLRKGLVPG